MSADSAIPQQPLPRRLHTTIVLLLVAPVLGVIVGVATNLINAVVSVEYFVRVLRCRIDNVREAVIIHGTVEGTLFGLVVGIICAIAEAATSGFRCPTRTAARVLMRIVGIVIVCWIIGGTIGAGFAIGNPDLFEQLVPLSKSSMSLAGFAWVGGSIWGIYAGAAIGAVTGPILLHREWKRMQPGREGFPVLMGSDSATQAGRAP